MSNNYWDDEEEDTDTEVETFSGDGSDLLKKLRKAKRADEKRIKELTEQLEGLSKVQRERTVKEVLEKKGVNAKATRLILKDLDDVSEESVNNWLDDNADLFGLSVAQEAPAAIDIDRAALRQQDMIAQNALTPTQADDVLSRINGATSAEEIIAMIHQS
jgi:hypothetical protein